MKGITQITYNLFYLTLFFPVLSYITFGVMGLNIITDYFEYIFFLYGVFFILFNKKKIKFPSILYFLIFYSLLLSIWEIKNGGLDNRGFISIILNKSITSVIFIVVIIYNTNFDRSFIKRSIFIIKITVIFAAITSVIQIIEYSFLDANPIWSHGKFGDTLIGNLYEDRRNSIFGYVNQNELGLSYMPLLSVLIGFMLYQRSKLYYLFLFLGGITAFLSNTRYVMIAFIFITFQILLVKKLKVSGVLTYLLIIAISSFLLLQFFSFLGYDIIAWSNTRLFHEGSIQETTRYKAIYNFLIFFPRNIFFGTGVFITDEIKAASQAIGSSQIHVGYLAHLVSYGIIGSLFLFGFWFSLARKLFISAKQSKYWGSFIAFAIFLFANVTMVYYSIFFYGIFYALIFDKFFSDKQKFELKNINTQQLSKN